MYLQTLFITKEGRFYICRLLYVHVLFLFHMIILLIEGLCKYDVINDLYLLILSKIQNPFHISHMPQEIKGHSGISNRTERKICWKHAK